MKCLILGGTADGRKLAQRLHRQGLDVIYSVAGLVRTPAVDCVVVSGGFRLHGGLEKYCKNQSITMIIDVTHPYANQISATAIQAAIDLDIVYCCFVRKPWLAQKDDIWFESNDWRSIQPYLKSYSSILLSCGQLSQNQIDELAKNRRQTQVIRTAVKLTDSSGEAIILPKTMRWVKAIGPFKLSDERALLRENNIDAIVSKNSGGEATSAKLIAARELSIPVFMLQRPSSPLIGRLNLESCLNIRKLVEFDNIRHCEQFVLERAL